MKERKLWFRAKMYGWGWYPISWEGWAIILLYLFAVVKSTWAMPYQHSGSDALFALAVRIVPPTICLLIICYLKGERPRWRWGK